MEDTVYGQIGQQTTIWNVQRLQLCHVFMVAHVLDTGIGDTLVAFQCQSLQPGTRTHNLAHHGIVHRKEITQVQVSYTVTPIQSPMFDEYGVLYSIERTQFQGS